MIFIIAEWRTGGRMLSFPWFPNFPPPPNFLRICSTSLGSLSRRADSVPRSIHVPNQYRVQSFIRLKAEMEELTEYERQRLENVKRNEQMLAALRVQSAAQELRSATASNHKRVKLEQKGYRTPQQEKPAREEEPTVIRRSLRTRGLPPDVLATGASTNYSPILSSSPASSPAGPNKGFRVSSRVASVPQPTRTEGPLPLVSTYVQYRPGVSDAAFLSRLKSLSEHAFLADLRCTKLGAVSEVGTHCGSKGGRAEFRLEDLKLDSKDIARVVPERILCVDFLPCRERVIVVAGDKRGHLALWDVDSHENEGDGVHIYLPHAAPIAGIAMAPFSIEKVVSCSYDGFIRSMDIEKEVFDVLYNAHDEISAICQAPYSHQSLYFAQGGELKTLDKRVGDVSNSYNLHERRINSIDFNPQRPHLTSTSSTDGMACIWDLRNMGKGHAKILARVQHKRAVHSAYFSPHGDYLATTSYDDKVGLLSGLDSKATTMIDHYNQTNRWISSFRAIWGWDDQYLFIGNMRRAIDVICTSTKTISTLRSSFITAIPSRLAKHPFCSGTLAGATGGGQVYVWRSKPF